MFKDRLLIFVFGVFVLFGAGSSVYMCAKHHYWYLALAIPLDAIFLFWLIDAYSICKTYSMLVQRLERGECVRCGYDCRVSSHGCPECGYGSPRVYRP